MNKVTAPQALFRPALVLMAGRFLGFVAAFAIPVVLARVFNLQEFGTYKQLFLIVATLYGIAQCGMAESLYYFLPQESQRNGSYVFNTLVVLGSTGLLVLLMLWLWREEVANLLNNPQLAAYLPMIGLYLLFTLLAVVLEIVMTVRRQHLAASCSYAMSDLVRAVLLVLPVLWFADLYWLLAGALVFALLRVMAMRVYVMRQFGDQLHADAATLKKHLGYAIPFGLAGLIEIVQTNFHLYAVSWFFDTATFAIYAVGCLQIPLVDFLMSSTCNVMMVNMRESSLAGDHDAVKAIWLDSIRKLALVFCPLVGVLLVTAQQLIVLLFTDTYSASVPIFMVWTVSMLFATLLTDGALRVFAQTRFLILQNLVRLALIAGLIQWFLQQYQLTGAILVTLIATAVSKAMALARIKVVMALPFHSLLPWKQLAQTLLLATLAMLPALLFKILFVDGVSGLFLLIGTGTIYTLSYYLLLQWFGPMQDDERYMLSQWVLTPFLRLTARIKF